MSHTLVAESNHVGGAPKPFAVGTFNLENLARPGVEFYPGEKWTDERSSPTGGERGSRSGRMSSGA